MGRRNPNWIGLAFSLLYLICFLFLPFLQVDMLGITGLTLLKFGYGIMYIPLVLAITMAFSSVAMNKQISIIIGVVSFLITLVMTMTGQPILLSGKIMDVIARGGAIRAISIGIGGILCMILMASHIAAEFFMNRSTSGQESDTSPFDDKNIF